MHQTTLPYSPYQNAKQESFWGRIEGRLMAMLEGDEGLTLPGAFVGRCGQCQFDDAASASDAL
ncbi:hypothetical protein M2244_001227 [Rhodoferax antarcticus]|nr:hypothetical protein [Rhodoferax antarcticus]